VCLSTDKDGRRVMEREGGALSGLRKSGSHDAMAESGHWLQRAASMASRKGTRRGVGTAPACTGRQVEVLDERRCPGKDGRLGGATTTLRPPGVRHCVGLQSTLDRRR
jgi:hypothetical protein